MTEAESDMRKAVWSEAHGRADERVALTELPAEALALMRNGYLNVRQDAPDLWRVALTAEGFDLAQTLLG